MREGARRWLLAGHVAEWLGLSIWIGGLLVIVAAVIPAVFNSFGMEPGGRFLTRVFDGYNRLVCAAIGLLIAGGGVRVWLSGSAAESRPGRTEMLLLLAMIAIAVLVVFILEPESVGLQERAFAAQSEAAKKSAYTDFFRSHMIVRALYLVNLGLAIGLLIAKAKSHITPGRAS